MYLILLIFCTLFVANGIVIFRPHISHLASITAMWGVFMWHERVFLSWGEFAWVIKAFSNVFFLSTFFSRRGSITAREEGTFHLRQLWHHPSGLAGRWRSWQAVFVSPRTSRASWTSRYLSYYWYYCSINSKWYIVILDFPHYSLNHCP